MAFLHPYNKVEMITCSRLEFGGQVKKGLYTTKVQCGEKQKWQSWQAWQSWRIFLSAECRERLLVSKTNTTDIVAHPRGAACWDCVQIREWHDFATTAQFDLINPFINLDMHQPSLAVGEGWVQVCTSQVDPIIWSGHKRGHMTSGTGPKFWLDSKTHGKIKVSCFFLLRISALHYSTRSWEGFWTLASAHALCPTTHYSCLSISGAYWKFWGCLEVFGSCLGVWKSRTECSPERWA